MSMLKRDCWFFVKGPGVGPLRYKLESELSASNHHVDQI